MDGTICDSTPLHNAAWDEFVRAHLGSGLEPGDPRLVPGRTIDVLKSVLGREIAEHEFQSLHDDKERRYHRLAHGKMSPLRGLNEYLGLAARARPGNGLGNQCTPDQHRFQLA